MEKFNRQNKPIRRLLVILIKTPSKSLPISNPITSLFQFKSIVVLSRLPDKIEIDFEKQNVIYQSIQKTNYKLYHNAKVSHRTKATFSNIQFPVVVVTVSINILSNNIVRTYLLNFVLET